MSLKGDILKRTKRYWLPKLSESERTEFVSSMRTVQGMSTPQDAVLTKFASAGINAFSFNLTAVQLLYVMVDFYLDSLK